MTEFKTIKVQYFQISSLPIHLTKMRIQKVDLKVDLQGKERWFRINRRIRYFRLLYDLKVNFYCRMLKRCLKKVADVFIYLIEL